MYPTRGLGASETGVPQEGDEYPPGSGNIITEMRHTPQPDAPGLFWMVRRTAQGATIEGPIDYSYLSQFSGAYSGDEQNDQAAQALQAAGVQLVGGRYLFPDGSATRPGTLQDPLEHTAYWRYITELERINPEHSHVVAARQALEGLRYRDANWDAYFRQIDAAIAASQGEYRRILERQREDYTRRRAEGFELTADYINTVQLVAGGEPDPEPAPAPDPWSAEAAEALFPGSTQPDPAVLAELEARQAPPIRVAEEPVTWYDAAVLPALPARDLRTLELAPPSAADSPAASDRGRGIAAAIGILAAIALAFRGGSKGGGGRG